MSAGPGLPGSQPDRYSDQPIKVSPRMTVDSTCAPPVIGARVKLFRLLPEHEEQCGAERD